MHLNRMLLAAFSVVAVAACSSDPVSSEVAPAPFTSIRWVNGVADTVAMTIASSTIRPTPQSRILHSAARAATGAIFRPARTTSRFSLRTPPPPAPTFRSCRRCSWTLL